MAVLERLQRPIERKVQEELLKHPGKWAAITRTRVIAIGDSSVEVLRVATQKGVRRPILYQIPPDGNITFFY
jgi:hypothetical protein